MLVALQILQRTRLLQHRQSCETDNKPWDPKYFMVSTGISDNDENDYLTLWAMKSSGFALILQTDIFQICCLFVKKLTSLSGQDFGRRKCRHARYKNLVH